MMIEITEECLSAVCQKFVIELAMGSEMTDHGIRVDVSVDTILNENESFMNCMCELSSTLFDNERDRAAGTVMAIAAYRIFKAQYEAEQMK